MDSFTQIVLGAAAGEVVLGKKIGNRAMVWGAVGGTIPDLDVLGKFFLSNIDNLAFHRGISHSIAFSVVGAVLFGWLVHQVYKSPYHKWIAVFFKAIAAVLVVSALQFLFSRLFPDNYIPIILVALGLMFFLYGHIKKSYFSEKWTAPEATVRDWQWLFFWSLFTHPILDCFTMYGTQLFAPFSDVRIAWSTISVADPAYTLPFFICLLVAARYAKDAPKRRFWNYMGIALSSAYLLFTVYNKHYVNRLFANTLQQQNIPAERFISNANILSNIVWNCTAETVDAFYVGQYSLFDEVEMRFTKVEKNHQLLNHLDSDPTLHTLRWFCNDYFTVNQLDEGYQFNDLRFGTFSGEGKGKDDYIFRFKLTDRGSEGYYMENAEGGPPKGAQQDIFGEVWKRIKGKKQG